MESPLVTVCVSELRQIQHSLIRPQNLIATQQVIINHHYRHHTALTHSKKKEESFLLKQERKWDNVFTPFPIFVSSRLVKLLLLKISILYVIKFKHRFFMLPFTDTKKQ